MYITVRACYLQFLHRVYSGILFNRNRKYESKYFKITFFNGQQKNQVWEYV